MSAGVESEALEFIMRPLVLFISAFLRNLSELGCREQGSRDDGQRQSSSDRCEFFLVRGDSGEEMPIDADGDGLTDEQDQCPGTLTGELVDSEGCSQSQRDADADGVTDDVDQCPGTPADEPADSEGCSQSQLDDDADGVSNAVDECPSSSPGAAVNEVGCEDLSGQVRAVYESDLFDHPRQRLPRSQHKTSLVSSLVRLPVRSMYYPL